MPKCLYVAVRRLALQFRIVVFCWYPTVALYLKFGGYEKCLWQMISARYGEIPTTCLLAGKTVLCHLRHISKAIQGTDCITHIFPIAHDAFDFCTSLSPLLSLRSSLKVFSEMESIRPPPLPVNYDRRSFLLHGKPFFVLSGSVHYVRVHPSRWHALFQSFKDAGLNTLETCKLRIHPNQTLFFLLLS